MRTAGSPGSRGGASRVNRSSPLGSLSVLYVGFILLVLLSQLSGRLLSDALGSYGTGTAAQIASIQGVSTDLAYAASAVGLAFTLAVLLTVRSRVDPEITVYKKTGLPAPSALRLMLLSHPILPAASALAAGAVAWSVDSLLGLDGTPPAFLAIAFAGVVYLWLTVETLASFSRGTEGGRGRTG